MELRKEINAVFLYLKSIDVKIDKDDYIYQVESHPETPSLLAFSDAFNFFGIPNGAFNVGFEELEVLPETFLTILDLGEGHLILSYIEKKEDHFMYTDNEGIKKDISSSEICVLWTGAVLVAEGNDQIIKSSNTFYNKVLPGLVFFAGLTVMYFIGGWYLMGFSGIAMLGLFFSFEAIKTELGFESGFSNQFCDGSEKSSCSQIINSEKGKIAGFKLSDLSVFLFGTQLFLLIIFNRALLNDYYFLIFISLLACIPFTLYSFYFQMKVEKKWCPICLSIIGVIYAEIVYLSFNSREILNNYTLDIKTISLFAGVLTVFVGGYFLIKRALLSYSSLKKDADFDSRYIRHYPYFKKILTSKDPVLLKADPILIGNPDAPVSITFITSPLCSYCKEAHEFLQRIYTHYKDQVNIKIRFNMTGVVTAEVEEMLIQLLNIFHTKGEQKFIEALHDWYSHREADKWLQKYSITLVNRTSLLNKLVSVSYENLQNNFFFTPHYFINNYEFPVRLNKKYIELFMPDLVEDQWDIGEKNIPAEEFETQYGQMVDQN
ncbi:vitamin K epoxide reductase family protein [Chryseobacterium lathyri]|uniref:Membrane protein/thiol-disulfide isomerase/thioredoxin n=1 Tax=Chryseobacterium lathyri TaxID=395933 RepID=A0ABT9SH35_9FLAO|nr:vitamin K epoxide reductase family protein [Chryseobacterium lathyri]MDP9958733.1 putative membrane protein/thiol-disulfide isomerase/thioredoxin [Chryseobacterium lathyri]